MLKTCRKEDNHTILQSFIYCVVFDHEGTYDDNHLISEDTLGKSVCFIYFKSAENL